MPVNEPYTMLLAALPYLPAPGSGRELPITRLQLQQRLNWLSPEDQQRLRWVDTALHWLYLPVELTDEQVIRRSRMALEAIDCDFLRSILLERMEMRTFVVALRHRSRGEPLPRESPWGIGRFVKQIETHFSDPAFGLGHLYPWLTQAHRLLQADAPLELENLLVQQAWKRLVRVEDRHGFDFAAVALYVLRWEILHRFFRRHAETAVTRFDSLVAQALEASSFALESST